MVLTVKKTKETVVWQMFDKAGNVVSERTAQRTVYHRADGTMQVTRPTFSDKQPVVRDDAGRLVTHDGVVFELGGVS